MSPGAFFGGPLRERDRGAICDGPADGVASPRSCVRAAASDMGPAKDPGRPQAASLIRSRPTLPSLGHELAARRRLNAVTRIGEAGLSIGSVRFFFPGPCRTPQHGRWTEAIRTLPLRMHKWRLGPARARQRREDEEMGTFWISERAGNPECPRFFVFSKRGRPGPGKKNRTEPIQRNRQRRSAATQSSS